MRTLVGNFNGIPVYTEPGLNPDHIYFVNDDFDLRRPKRKDGKPDMRYMINKLEAAYESISTPPSQGSK